MKKGFLLLVWLTISLFSCQNNGSIRQGSDRLLAEVKNRKLYLSELEGMFPLGTTPTDSTLIINAYVNRWVKEALILNEAERNLPSDLNIDQLVRDYRASLLRNTYEQVLVEELLDSIVADDELRRFYQKNKEQYELQTPIAKCHFLKVPLPVPELDSVLSWWSKLEEPGILNKLNNYANDYAQAYELRDSSWIRIEQLALELPEGTLTPENAVYKKDAIQEDGTFQYFLRVYEVKNRAEIAPLAYIEDQARKVILHSRKIKILKEKRDDLYDLEMRKNNIKVYTQ
ncbi:MAG: hypothetical protein HRU40_06345 [Saprospiraceae bacterium]|nr:hypothetical protein [Saprospiraceae bacterium]